MAKKILTISGTLILLVLIGIQFYPVDRSVPNYSENTDFIYITQPSWEVESLLKSSCYDCHSYQTTYPWYANIAPVSFWLQDHIDEGRDELNFSKWKNYSEDRANHKLEEAIEKIQEGEMPLKSYTFVHSEARLNDPQKDELIRWFRSLIQETDSHDNND